ncbi:MAG: phosphoribosylamine--glycine ligase [Candidatus Sumerlaeia bacterium]|nr:phosphoribosylamine--glycine ligase [Candidatus Sumerlaeia bacterium]
MDVLVVGSGGREHALCWRLRRSPSVRRLLCPNGNPGIARVAEAPREDLADWAAWAGYAARERVDLVVVGPEAPLAGGLADLLRARGIPVFGPGADGARLESSKSFTREVLESAGIDMARGESFEDAARAKDFACALGLPVVVKADGLAAGKGVVIAQTRGEADAAIDDCLLGGRFGAAGARVVVEEFLAGEEASIIAVCDGERAWPLPPAQDHKRAFDGDLGPNTGGMGAYAPAPLVGEELLAGVYGGVLLPTLEELRRRGIDFRGVLYAGLMVTADGPKVLEYNCRFGDPETQVLMPLLEGDLAEALLACAEGRLRDGMLGARPDHALGVVLASGGYPGDFKAGHPISGLPDEDAEDAMVFHAGTKAAPDGAVLTAGGRVLTVVGTGSTLARARDRSYVIAEKIQYSDKQFRADIGWRALDSSAKSS